MAAIASSLASAPEVDKGDLEAATEELAARDPALGRLIGVAGPFRHRPADADGHFGALARAIVFQQLAGRAAAAIHNRVRALVEGEFTPKALLLLPDETLRSAGLSASKVASLRDLAKKFLDQTVTLDGVEELSDDEIIDRLVRVRGIGRWTAEMFLLFELRRLDVWPVDDLGVRKGYGLIWKLDETPNAKALAPLGDRFRPYRSLAAWYCWQAVHLKRGGVVLP